MFIKINNFIKFCLKLLDTKSINNKEKASLIVKNKGISDLFRNRYVAITIIVVGMGLSLFLIIKASEENLVFFYTPSEIKDEKSLIGKKIRLGGMVLEGSVEKKPQETQFIITDYKKEIKVRYKGVLPDLFGEGQGVIVVGIYNGEIFKATEMLVKHDETYMPPEVVEALTNHGAESIDENEKKNIIGTDPINKAISKHYRGSPHPVIVNYPNKPEIYWHYPSEIIRKYINIDYKKKIQVAGVVKKKSLNLFKKTFIITDYDEEITVKYSGRKFPKLFEENLPILMIGSFTDKTNKYFITNDIITRCPFPKLLKMKSNGENGCCFRKKCCSIVRPETRGLHCSRKAHTLEARRRGLIE
jgi:cytochrome c-type biogenesis protein CcmE